MDNPFGATRRLRNIFYPWSKRLTFISSKDIRPDTCEATEMVHSLAELKVCSDLFDGWAEELNK